MILIKLVSAGTWLHVSRRGCLLLSLDHDNIAIPVNVYNQFLYTCISLSILHLFNRLLYWLTLYQLIYTAYNLMVILDLNHHEKIHKTIRTSISKLDEIINSRRVQNLILKLLLFISDCINTKRNFHPPIIEMKSFQRKRYSRQIVHELQDFTDLRRIGSIEHIPVMFETRGRVCKFVNPNL